MSKLGQLIFDHFDAVERGVGIATYVVSSAAFLLCVYLTYAGLTGRIH